LRARAGGPGTLSQGVRRLRLLDPEGMVHLLAVLAPEEEDDHTA
jgi:hypothetical protein